MSIARLPALIYLMLATAPLCAQEGDSLEAGLDWDYCGLRPTRLGSAPLPAPPGKTEPISIAADDFNYDQNSRVLSLKGNIDLQQGSRQVRAQAADYSLDSEDLGANGELFLSQPGIRILGDEGKINFKTNQGEIRQPCYRLHGPLNARGKAQRAQLLDEGKTHFDDILFTACPPGRQDWELEASRVDIDQVEGWGIARNAKLRVQGLPVLYTPYLSFPIDDRRKTGFLPPSLGNSNRSGFQLVTPYYFNIAPNMDATLTPTLMSKRGLLLGGEWRYLSPIQSINLYAEGIPEDRQYDNQSRGAMRLVHDGNYGAGWSSAIRFQDVSDKQYLVDFSNSLELTSLRNLERLGILNYRNESVNARLTLQEFRNVDSSIPPQAYPYSRLPQLEITPTPWRLEEGLEIALPSQYNYFAHETRVYGGRATLQPKVSWPMRRTYGQLVPSLYLWGGAYSLNDQKKGDPQDPSYAIPTFNLDGQLVFERQTPWFGHSVLQTLEPRLSYLYTPYEDQSDIPIFDTTDIGFSYGTLFLPNRFVGYDRVGDANQVTLGISTRLLEANSGQELLRASLGKPIHLEDPQVWLPGKSQESQSSEALVAELAAQLMEDVRGRTTLRWNPQADEADNPLEKLIVELRYQSPQNHILNLAYRYDVGNTEATRYRDLDFSASWPIGSQLQVVGRWYYSLYNEKINETFAGFSYGKCCWKLNLLGRYINNQPDSDGETSVMVQIELAGLAAFGDKIDKFLERGIYGYTKE